MKDNKIKNKTKISFVMEDIIFYSILIPLIAISCAIIYQRIYQPDKIPDIFGFKMFVVLDDKMDEMTQYGDLVFTKNLNPNELKSGDIIAFRNKTNKVTIHKIIDIRNVNNVKQFTMKTAINEIGDTKYVPEDRVEGIIVNRIEKIGLIIIYMQNPYVILLLICIVLIIGLIIYYIMQELDKRDIAKMEIK